MREVIGVILLGWPSGLLDRLVVPVVCPPEVERDTDDVQHKGDILEIPGNNSPLAKMASHYLQAWEEVKYSARAKGIQMHAQVEMELHSGA